MRDSKSMSESIEWRRDAKPAGLAVVQPAGSPEEWARTRMAILRALVRFPEAKAAVVLGLKRLAAEEDP